MSSGDRRADLVLVWSEKQASHVEVKIWDEAFAKTVATAEGLRAKYRNLEFEDYVLLPDDNEESWRCAMPSAKIGVVTWTLVSRELRAELLRRADAPQWRAFARAFCGAIEQKIMGVRPVPRGFEGVLDPASAVRLATILRGVPCDG